MEHIATISDSSTAQKISKGAPTTPPQIEVRLETLTATTEPGFDDLFPWHKPQADQAKHELSVPIGPPVPGSSAEGPSYIAAFQRRHSPQVSRESLRVPFEQDIDYTASSSTSSPRIDIALPSGTQTPGMDFPFAQTSMSSADMYLAVHQATRQSPAASVSNVSKATSASPQLEAPQIPSSSYPVQTRAETSSSERNGGYEVLDIFEDDKLPGYQVWPRGVSSSAAMAVRIPRQIVGWKAILMDAGNFDDAAFSSDAALAKKARRASKVLGKQGWEVRQERLKNSYDFRRGSGIWASMHAGHRLFKHDWHLIVKDGSRFVWRMDKKALALHREEDEVKVAEYRRAVPSSPPPTKYGNVDAGYKPDMARRIGSFKFDTQPSQNGTVFDTHLALASLIAVFGARGGHTNVSAAYEASSSPMRQILERQRQDEPDREEVMLVLPRPGFARDAESVLSDTTDEDADPPANRRPAQAPMHALHQSADVVQRRPSPGGGRKRFSSFFGRRDGSPAVLREDDRSSPEDESMTDSQRIAKQYRSQGVGLGS